MTKEEAYGARTNPPMPSEAAAELTGHSADVFATERETIPAAVWSSASGRRRRTSARTLCIGTGVTSGGGGRRSCLSVSWEGVGG